MSEFTKGPWIRSVNANGCVFVTHSDMRRNGGHIIASTIGKDEVANANLIAAAPDMLEAFEELILDISINHSISLKNMIGGSTREALNKALEAIAKAKGEIK